jgi:hypothetical protein
VSLAEALKEVAAITPISRDTLTYLAFEFADKVSRVQAEWKRCFALAGGQVGSERGEGLSGAALLDTTQTGL